jgi:sugar (pentulose or hexulose) kinase
MAYRGNERDLFIGIDFGGSTLKSILYDRNGNAVAGGYEVVPVISPQRGWQEMDMDLVWEATKKTLKKIVSVLEERINDVRVIGVTSAGHGAWLVGIDGNPVRNGIPWTDSRAVEIIEGYNSDGTSERYYQITGSGLIRSNSTVLLKWLSLYEPENLAQSKAILMAQEWIHFKLTGDIRTDCTGASISAGDIHTNQYSSELLKLMDIERYAHLFPPIKSSFEVTGKILPEVAAEIGLPESVQINNAPTDITTCTVGVGNIREGDAYSCLGTGLGSLFVTKKLELERFLNAQTMAIDTPDVKYVHSVIPIFGSPNQDWFIRNFCGEDVELAKAANINVFQFLANKVSEIPAGAEGLLYNPLICPFGRQLPFLHKTDTAHFIGLEQRHTRHHMFRAIYEGIAFAIRRVYENTGLELRNTVLSGGGARSDVFCQIICDVLGLPVKVPSDEECGAKGAAISAAYAGKFFDTHEETVRSMVRYERYFEPDETSHNKYDKIFALFKEVYSQLIPIWDKLDELKKVVNF